MKKKKSFLDEAVEKVNEGMRRRRVGIYDFPDHSEDNKTGKKCRVCSGELLKEFRIISNGVIGIGHVSHAELIGYYCSQCGIRYKNLPKWG